MHAVPASGGVGVTKQHTIQYNTMDLLLYTAIKLAKKSVRKNSAGLGRASKDSWMQVSLKRGARTNQITQAPPGHFWSIKINIEGCGL